MIKYLKIVNHLTVEVNQEPEHGKKEVNLRPKRSESETGISKFCFSPFVAIATNQNMLFKQI